MNGTDEGPVLQLLICFAEILQSLPVEKLHLAQRAHRSHEPGYVVGDLPPGEFSHTQGVLSPLTVLDVNTGSVPFNYLPRFVSQRVGTKQEPAIRGVEAPQACFHLTRLA